MIQRYGRESALNSFIKPALIYTTIASILFLLFSPYIDKLDKGLIISIAIIGMWRYGLLIVNYIRALIYSYIVYPNYLQKIESISYEDRYPKNIFFIIPSYKEDPWVTTEVFQSLITDINTIPSYATLIIATASKEEDAIIRNIFDSHPSTEKITLIFQKQQDGKRIAMGHALRVASRDYNKGELDEKSVTIFMDGDTYLPIGTLKKSLPFFVMEKSLGAATTNEIAYVHSESKWYKDWFNLKFAQRHILFQSHALSKRVMTLTGRFSIFRSSIILTEDFISTIENDIIIDKNYGKFRFLMGDDKSSWFYMMKNNWNMLYLPNVLIYSLESRDGDFLEISKTLPYRWYGNTLRNNKRARQLKNQPFFIKYLLFDQIALMWTSLVGVTAMLFFTLFVNVVYLPLYISWIIYVRVFQMAIFASSGHRVTMKTLPLMLYSQWYGAYVKIRAFYHLHDQKWSKGDEIQSADNNSIQIQHWSMKYYSSFRMYIFISLFLFFILTLYTKILFFPSTKLLARENISNNKVYLNSITDDGKDDAKAINDLIKKSHENTTIILPSGTLDLFEPILIQKSNITLLGDNTTFLSHMHNNEEAIVLIKGDIGKKIGYTKNNLYNSTKLNLDTNFSIQKEMLLLIEQENSKKFVSQELGSQKWYKQYPIIRSEIVKVLDTDQNNALLQFKVKSNLGVGSKVKILNPVSNITLKNIIIDSVYKSTQYEGIYENSKPELMIDSIKILYALDINLESIKILNSGSNPLVFERTYNAYAKDIFISGAINKGKGGNGYLRLNKSFHNTLENIYVENIRHIVFQWSSAYNTIDFLTTKNVDINFHGGGTHHNEVNNAILNIDTDLHKWGKIYYTPKDASWAPPDYETNYVKEKS